MIVTDNAPATECSKPIPAAEAAARKAALAGGWDARPMCSLTQRKRTFWAWTVATFFGAGFGKPGPGTWGSVAATLIWTTIAFFGRHAPVTLFTLTLAGIALAVALGVPAATISARESGRDDPGFVVIDEVAGQWITMLPLAFMPLDWRHVLVSLLLFRIFDVWKPFPIRRIENLPEGWGIVFDDVAAGLYAGAVLLLLNRWI